MGRTRTCGLIGLPFFFFADVAAYAQPCANQIAVEVTGQSTQCYDSGDPVSVNIGTLGNSDILIRIYDDATTPVNSLGPLTITGSVATGATGRLKILIANRSVTAFPGFAESSVSPGVIDFGDSTSGDVLIISNAALRNRTKALVSISGNVMGVESASGDIVGSIDVGQVFRLQVLGRIVNSTLVGGEIKAHIMARASDSSSVTDDGDFGRKAIEQVRAGQSILGDVIATGIDQGGGSFLPGSIERIVVGPTSGIAGIQGDILAEHGKIGSIYTTGPIGSGAVQTKIWAGSEIKEIRALNELAGDGYEEVNFNADIDSGRSYTIASTPVPFFEGRCGLIQTGGDIAGPVHAGNMMNQDNGLAGIYAKGDVTGDISIDFALSRTRATAERGRANSGA